MTIQLCCRAPASRARSADSNVSASGRQGGFGFAISRDLKTDFTEIPIARFSTVIQEGARTLSTRYWRIFVPAVRMLQSSGLTFRANRDTSSQRFFREIRTGRGHLPQRRELTPAVPVQGQVVVEITLDIGCSHLLEGCHVRIQAVPDDHFSAMPREIVLLRGP